MGSRSPGSRRRTGPAMDSACLQGMAPPVLRLRGGGGYGGSIPGRYDLVDIKKSIMSGNNRGRYTSFDHNSMVWGEDHDGDDAEFKIAVAENCAITQTTLKHPVVACKFGYLYNKEPLVAALITKTLEEQFQHVRNLKDVFPANLTVNPEYTDKVKQSELLDANRVTHFQCPVTQLPMNGKYRFVLIKTSLCVLSERGLKETKSTNEQGQKVCPMTSVPYEDEDILLLHQHLVDPAKYAEEHRAETRARAKK